MKNYVLLINTNSYAGNFEREMTAYCTGVIGECEVGEEEIENFNNQIANHFNISEDFFENVLEQRPDEDGCYRPCQMEKDKYGEYNSVGINFYQKPTEKEIEIIKYAANEFCKERHIKLKDFSLKILEIYENEETIDI